MNAYTPEDFKALGKWLEDAEHKFFVINSQQHHTHEESQYLSLFANLIARVMRIRGDYLALHHNTEL